MLKYYLGDGLMEIVEILVFEIRVVIR